MIYNPFLMAAAVIPAVILLVKVYKSDKSEKESKGLLLSLVILGIISTFIAIVAENIGQSILNSFLKEGTVLYNLLMYYIVVGMSEEGAKYLLLKKRTWKSQEFNYLFDGVVYAVFVSLGFALWENIAYVGQYGFSTAVARAVTAIPGHASFGVFMGCYYSYAKRAYNRGQLAKSKSLRIIAFLIPAFIHGTYDFLTTFETYLSSLVFLVFVIILFITAYRRVNTLSKNDRSIQYHTIEPAYWNFTGDNRNNLF